MNVDSVQALSDPGGVRPLAARWTIETDLILESAAHLGGGSSNAADMVVLRDARTGGPLLPGTSTAGALRSHLADVLRGYRTNEDPSVAALFGDARGDHLGRQSPLVVFDSRGVLPESHSVEIRDGVQIDTARGTAEDHKKFDQEVLPAGTRFPLRFDLLVPATDSEAELVSLLVTALAGFSSGDIALGARRSRGLGMARAETWWAARHDLASRAGWMEWLLSDHISPIPRGTGTSDASCACVAACPDLALRQHDDRRRRVVAEIELRLKGALLVRSAPVGPDAPDAAHLQSAGRSVLPGTSLVGVLRSQALRVAGVARQAQGDAERWVERLFGPRMAGTTRDESAPLHASRLRVAEAVIEDGSRRRPTRVRIDRFTHGVVPGALFDEETEERGRSRVRMELRDPHPGEHGLLALLLKDLLCGDIAVGGTAAVGRGVVGGSATLRLEDGREVLLDPARPADASVDRGIQELWSSPALGGTT
jgi:CRISPR/Cas system CSM-associated protein Csm3 (group 7 of RAMP superfamily)